MKFIFMNKYFLSLSVLILISLTVSAQQVIISDDNWPQNRSGNPLPKGANRSTEFPDTLSFSVDSPFFDDFSDNSSIPDSSLWWLKSGFRYPLSSNSLSVNPPTKGVLTFDGANSLGKKYSNELSTGPADSLLTHYINLAGRGLADGIKLSFFLQPQGKGNAPEPTDMFQVYFRDINGNFVLQQEIEGTSQAAFRQYVISVDKPAFFHTEFQILFTNNGSLNGYLDQWHLDYVFLGANRATDGANTRYNDFAPLYLNKSPFHPFTAIPQLQYKSGMGDLGEFSVQLSNLSSNQANTTLNASISDQTGNNIFSGTTSISQNVNQASNSQEAISFTQTFTRQNLSQEATYQLEIAVPPVDNRTDNNQINTSFPIDSLWAYDDGEADAGYGINQPRGFGIQLDLAEPDMLNAVWVSFVPSMSFNQITNQSVCLENRAFRLAVWDAEHPDSTQYRQLEGTRVRYGDSLDHFERFPLSIPQPLQGRVWVGVQQLDSNPLGVGLDLDYDNGGLMYWDSSGVWVQTGIAGSLMIRAELANTGIISVSNEEIIRREALRIYPNPVENKVLRLEWGSKLIGTKLYLTIIDHLGQVVFSKQEFVDGPKSNIVLPKTLTSGIYSVIVRQMANSTGNSQQFVRKILLP